MISFLKNVLKLLVILFACFGAYQFYEIKLSSGYDLSRFNLEFESIISGIELLVGEIESMISKLEQIFKI